MFGFELNNTGLENSTAAESNSVCWGLDSQSISLG